MTAGKKIYVGIDVGSTTVKVAAVNNDGQMIGNPVYLRQDEFSSQAIAVQTSLTRFLADIEEYTVAGLGITGSGRELNRALLGADLTRTEIFAHAVGLVHILRTIPVYENENGNKRLMIPGSLLEVGGQDAKVIVFDDQARPEFFNMNTICSAGTGEFLKQLADEAGLTLNDLGPLALASRQPAAIDATCTVFSKRDFRHLTQKGVPLPDRLMGVCQALVRNYLTNVVQHNKLHPPVFFQGGVAYNQAVRTAFVNQLKTPVYVTPHHAVAGALGMALITREEQQGNNAASYFRTDFDKRSFCSQIRYCHGCANGCELVQACEEHGNERVILDTLGGRCAGSQRAENVHTTPHHNTHISLPVISSTTTATTVLTASTPLRSSNDRYFAGLDGGSRGTKYALVRSDGWLNGKPQTTIVAAGQVETGGDAINACLQALKHLQAALPAHAELAGIGTTGSAGELFQHITTNADSQSADVRCTEIIAHYMWASHRYPNVGTVMDIGGNDAKFITVTDNGLDFAMNDKCAAGTGSFLEAAARRLHIPIDEYGSIAMQSQQPVRIAGRCAVFGESDLIHKARTGFSSHDLLLGLAFAVCRTYISDLCRGRLLRLPVVAQGGVFLNSAVAYAFRQTLSLNESDFIVDQDANAVLCAGALGVALATCFRWETGANTGFKGFSTIFSSDYQTTCVSCQHPECWRRCDGLVLLLENGHPIAGYKSIDCQLGMFAGIADQTQQAHMHQLLSAAQ